MLTYPLIKLVRKHVTELIQSQQSLSIEPLEALVLQGELFKLSECLVRPGPVREVGEPVHTQVNKDDIPCLEDIVRWFTKPLFTFGNISRGREGWYSLEGTIHSG